MFSIGTLPSAVCKGEAGRVLYRITERMPNPLAISSSIIRPVRGDIADCFIFSVFLWNISFIQFYCSNLPTACQFFYHCRI